MKKFFPLSFFYPYKENMRFVFIRVAAALFFKKPYILNETYTPKEVHHRIKKIVLRNKIVFFLFAFGANLYRSQFITHRFFNNRNSAIRTKKIIVIILMQKGLLQNPDFTRTYIIDNASFCL